MDTGDLRVPKHEVEAEIALEGGTRRRMVFFLSDASLAHVGPERISDIMNSSQAFVPARDPKTRQVVFLSHSAIMTVRASPIVATETETWEALYRHPVEVTLRGGGKVRGAMEYSLAPEHSRVIDYLSQPHPFFAIADGKELVLINKHHTLQVAPLDEAAPKRRAVKAARKRR